MTSIKSGFTLLELLIAIGIVVIVTAVSAIGFSGAQKRGRDVRRRSDAESLRSALELYYNQNNAYPTSTATYSSDATWTTGIIKTALKDNGYISSVPVDPINDTNLKYGYVSSAGTAYCVKVLQESNASTDPNYTGTVAAGANTYYVLKYGDATECSSL